MQGVIVELGTGAVTHVRVEFDDAGHALLDPATGAVVERVEKQPGDAVGAGLYIDRGRSSRLSAFSLATGDVVWETDFTAISVYAAYDETNNLFLLGDQSPPQEVLAVAAGDGRTVWGPVEISRICGLDRGKLVVSVNGQLAILDAATGNQLSFDPSTSACPQVLPGILVQRNSANSDRWVTLLR